MSLVTVDTSVIISVIANEVHKSRLIDLTKGMELIAPQSLHWEIGNAFSSMFKRKKIDLELAEKAINIYSMIPITFYDVELKNSIKISYQYRIYAYDAYFIDCAINNKTPLLTLDALLAETARKNNIEVLGV